MTDFERFFKGRACPHQSFPWWECAPCLNEIAEAIRADERQRFADIEADDVERVRLAPGEFAKIIGRFGVVESEEIAKGAECGAPTCAACGQFGCCQHPVTGDGC